MVTDPPHYTNPLFILSNHCLLVLLSKWILLDKSLMRVISRTFFRTRIGLCGGTELSKYQWSLMQFENNLELQLRSPLSTLISFSMIVNPLVSSHTFASSFL